jgi:hypothetical protein
MPFAAKRFIDLARAAPERQAALRDMSENGESSSVDSA